MSAMTKFGTDNLPDNLVPHPRYGITLHRSGEGYFEREIRRSFFRLANAVIFPESAILADMSKQNTAGWGRKFYVDLLETCRTCNRPFIFYAKEQKFWFEELKFFVDTYCAECPDCRASDRALRIAAKRFGELVGRRDLTDEELKVLILAAAKLIEIGKIKNIQKLSWARAEAKKRLKSHMELDRLANAIAMINKKVKRDDPSLNES